MLESAIEKKVCDYARDRGILVYKFTSPARIAVPDRLFLVPFKMPFFIEFKAPGKKPTVMQEREHQRLRDAGYKVYVIDDVGQGKRVIDENT